MESSTALLLVKSMQIIGVVVWFSGLFYLGRLFVYHREALEEAADGKAAPGHDLLTARFAVMERRLYVAITQPGMILTVIFGAALIYWYAFPWWLQIKVGLVVVLIGYHHLCGKLQRDLANGTCEWTSRRFRMWNEVPTLLLVAIVFLVVMKDVANVAFLGLGLLGLAAVIIATVRKLSR